MARTLERACFDYLLLEDASAVNEAFDGSTEIYLKRGIAVPRQDKSIVAALMPVDVEIAPADSMMPRWWLTIRLARSSGAADLARMSSIVHFSSCQSLKRWSSMFLCQLNAWRVKREERK